MTVALAVLGWLAALWWFLAWRGALARHKREKRAFCDAMVASLDTIRVLQATNKVFATGLARERGEMLETTTPAIEA